MNPFCDDFYTTPQQSDCVDTEVDFKNEEHFFSKFMYSESRYFIFLVHNASWIS